MTSGKSLGGADLIVLGHGVRRKSFWSSGDPGERMRATTERSE